jgi:hypothetical protein
MSSPLLVLSSLIVLVIVLSVAVSMSTNPLDKLLRDEAKHDAADATRYSKRFHNDLMRALSISFQSCCL